MSAAATIQFALDTTDGMEFLRYWNAGEFDICRREWPEAPAECYVGADPMLPKTPASRWAQNGEPDPHGSIYDCERAVLTLGNLTDDELANGVFMNADQPMDIHRVLARDPEYHPPIVWLTAAKERIRWLSRALVEAQDALAASEAQGVGNNEREPFEDWWYAKINSGIAPLDIAFGMHLETLATRAGEAAPKGRVHMPMLMTRAMREVVDDEGWHWEDLLAAAESVTEDEYSAIARAVWPDEAAPVAVRDAKPRVEWTDAQRLALKWAVGSAVQTKWGLAQELADILGLDPYAAASDSSAALASQVVPGAEIANAQRSIDPDIAQVVDKEFWNLTDSAPDAAKGEQS